MTQPKVLVIDIETAPVIASVWGLFDQNVGLNMIRADWHLMSFSAKWLGANEVQYFDQQYAPDMTDDTDLLLRLHYLLDEADFAIAHNGNRFDRKKINARMITAGLPPYSPVRWIDTLREVRRVAAFTSNKLEFLTGTLCTEHQKLTHKKFPGFELWKECLLGNPEAWKEMKDYNIQDVLSLEELYLKLRPWMEGHPNFSVYGEGETGPVCNKCGSHRVQQRGTRRTNVGVYARYQCLDCKSWFRGRNMLNSSAERKALLAN